MTITAAATATATTAFALRLLFAVTCGRQTPFQRSGRRRIERLLGRRCFVTRRALTTIIARRALTLLTFAVRRR